jgi:hypothetical protein
MIIDIYKPILSLIIMVSGSDSMEIRKVLLRTDGIKYLIIPKNSELKKGDYVKITKMEDSDGKRKD